MIYQAPWLAYFHIKHALFNSKCNSLPLSFHLPFNPRPACKILFFIQSYQLTFKNVRACIGSHPFLSAINILTSPNHQHAMGYDKGFAKDTDKSCEECIFTWPGRYP